LNDLDHCGQEKIALACPIVEGCNWESVLRSGLGNMKFLPSAQRFAKYHPIDTADALKAFRRQGYGRHMNYMSLVDFENDVYQWVESEIKTARWHSNSSDN
jgi:hypothetical protein